MGQLPITAGDGGVNISAHGDELGFLFDVNDIFGNPIPGKKLTAESDLRVRNSITELLARFATIDLNSKTNGDGLFQAFSRNGAPFIKITEKLETGADFRFCSLSLFGVPLQALKALTCEGLLKNLSPLTNVAGELGSQLTGTLGLGGTGSGLLGGGGTAESSQPGAGGLLGTGLLGSGNTPAKPTKKRPNQGLGLLGL